MYVSVILYDVEGTSFVPVTLPVSLKPILWSSPVYSVMNFVPSCSVRTPLLLANSLVTVGSPVFTLVPRSIFSIPSQSLVVPSVPTVP